MLNYVFPLIQNKRINILYLYECKFIVSITFTLNKHKIIFMSDANTSVFQLVVNKLYLISCRTGRVSLRQHCTKQRTSYVRENIVQIHLFTQFCSMNNCLFRLLDIQREGGKGIIINSVPGNLSVSA